MYVKIMLPSSGGVQPAQILVGFSKPNESKRHQNLMRALTGYLRVVPIEPDSAPDSDSRLFYTAPRPFFVAAARSDLLLRLKDVVKHWVDHCEMTKLAGRGFFKAGAFERVASGAMDIGYVSKTGCRYLGLWPLPPCRPATLPTLPKH